MNSFGDDYKMVMMRMDKIDAIVFYDPQWVMFSAEQLLQ